MLAVRLITGQAYWWSGHSRARTAPEAHISSDVSPWVPCAGETHRHQWGFTGGTGQPSPRPAALTKPPRQTPKSRRLASRACGCPWSRYQRGYPCRNCNKLGEGRPTDLRSSLSLTPTGSESGDDILICAVVVHRCVVALWLRAATGQATPGDVAGNSQKPALLLRRRAESTEGDALWPATKAEAGWCVGWQLLVCPL
jgi:hypothetical protein